MISGSFKFMNIFTNNSVKKIYLIIIFFFHSKFDIGVQSVNEVKELQGIILIFKNSKRTINVSAIEYGERSMFQSCPDVNKNFSNNNPMNLYKCFLSYCLIFRYTIKHINKLFTSVFIIFSRTKDKHIS